MLATTESVHDFVVASGCRLSADLIRANAREMHTTICRFHPWDFLKTEGQITTIADYVTGTVAITQGDTAVTFTGSTPIASMITRFIQPGATDGSNGRWYGFRSINTGAGTAVLLDPWEGATVTAATFCIRQRYYRPPPDFDKAEVAKETSGNQVVWWKSREQFEREYSQSSASGQVWHLVPAPASRVVLYNTGTFAITQGTATVTITTGVVNSIRDKGRRFRAPQFPQLGDFTILDVSEGLNTYTLDRNWSEMTVAGQGIYQVDPIGEKQIELYPNPSTGNSSIHFNYFRVPPPLCVETDYPVWPAEMNDVWKQATLLRCFAPKPSDFEAEFQILMRNFMKRQGEQSNEVIPAGRWGMNRRGGSNFPSNFQPWSAWGGR